MRLGPSRAGMEICTPSPSARPEAQQSCALLPTRTLSLRLDIGVEAVALAIESPQAVLRALRSEVELLPAAPEAMSKRRAEFLAGRHAAALALAKIGLSGEVDRRVDRSPEWPLGAVGSISHGAGMAVAVVASHKTHRALGVDVEAIPNSATASELAPHVACEKEFDLLARTLTRAGNEVCLSLVFSAKESLFKCLFPLTGEFMEFDDAMVESLQLESAWSGSIALRLQRSLCAEFDVGRELRARFSLASGHVETLVCLAHGQ